MTITPASNQQGKVKRVSSSQGRSRPWATKGLPPKHAAHLRVLNRQWLSQHTTEYAGLPGNSSRSRLWDDAKVKQIEEAMWRGLCVSQREPGRHGLLDVDWADWVARAWRRRETWKQEQADIIKRKQKETVDRSTLRFLKRASRSEVDVPKRGRQLSVGTPTAIPSMLPSTVSTPTRPVTRPPSIASSLKAKPDEFSDQLTAGLQKTMSGTSSGSSASDEVMEKWCDTIRLLKGYEPLVTGKRDEWEVVEDDQRRSIFQVVPGAFPQGEQYHDRQPTEPATPPTSPSEATKDCTMVKPVFCLHFVPIPAPSATASNASTIRLKQRERSSGSIGSHTGWWAPGRRQSEITIKESDTQEFEIHFVQGKFALPYSHTSHTTRSRAASVLCAAKASLQKTLSGDSSTWSDSDGSSRSSGHNTGNLIIGGGDDDLPREAPEGAVGLVGGTFVVQGVSDPTERDAIAKTLQHLLYTIQSIKIELEVFDAFRVPRESDSPFNNASNIGPAKQDIVRRSSIKEPRERKGGIFGRFVGRDPREILDNLFRPNRSRLGQELPDDDPLHGVIQRSPSFDSLGLDSPPLGLVADRDMSVFGNFSTITAPSKDKSIFPVDPETDRDLLANIRRLKMSTTPGLTFPAPTLLERADAEARKRMADSDGGLGLIFGKDGPPGPLSERPSGYRSGGDVRVGLKAFRTDIDTFEGWARSQRLETLRCISIEAPPNDHGDPVSEICQKPEPETFVFYDAERDTALLDVIRGLQAEMDDMSACVRSGCVTTAPDHSRSWYHGNKKVVLRAKRVESAPQVDPQEMDDMVLRAWMSCSICSATSLPQIMTEGAACYSWGKLLELLIYSRTLQSQSFCSHTPDTHNFEGYGVVASIKVETSDVLDVRLPQMQVGPNVVKRKSGRDAAEDALESLVSEDKRSEEQDRLAQEIIAYAKSVDVVMNRIQDQVDISDAQMFHPDNILKHEFGRGDRTINLLLTVGVIERLQSELRKALAHIPYGLLNDARALVGLHDLSVVEALNKYLKDNKITYSLADGPFVRPEWLKGQLHALPGGSLLIREDDPSSIIAHTLSSLAYYAELGGPNKMSGQDHEAPTITMPDNCGDQWKVEVHRRDNTQDMFTLRNITKKQADVTAIPSKPPPMSVTQPVPSQQLSLEQVEGETGSHNHLGDLVKSIHKAACQDPVLARTDSPLLNHTSPSLGSLHEEPAGEEGLGSPKRSSRRSGIDHQMLEAMHLTHRSASGDETSLPITPNSSSGGKEEGWGSMTSNFTSAFFKMSSGVGETLGSFRMRGGDRSLSSMMGPLSSMSQTDNALATAHSRLPHFVFTYTLGERLKIICTVHYAEAFDSLRRRCAIEKAMIDSLSHVENWDASGGKSKAAFFMTKDKRFIVKELVAGWIGSDTNAMLELAPEYFKFTQSTYNKATSLVKIVGFFSVFTHDRKSGTKKNMDLLVMENLFHNHEISKTYDLKGIESRKVAKPSAPPAGTAEAKAAGSATLWDGDWLEAISHWPVLIYPHAKRILTEAISADTRFLAGQSVMDYSLLLGLEKDKKEIVVGIVDSIGSFDLWKTLESKGKMLTRGGDVTVIPPDQYKDRFETALNKYLLACPDKWSRPVLGDTPTRPLTSFL